ncbi:hypothetical protein PR048_012706 [Dryococelus australis]|uniref:Polyprotein n=1 Tax=Dryococelus australis TaxID=614101 RepID=A0ABQ9HQR6_9NEOP|nr:hypothetical protein PR048_012706 [Dryococelus australis]
MQRSPKELHIVSDSCPGQNCYNTVFRRNSFLPFDCDFGVIERTTLNIDRIYSSLDYVRLIATSSKKETFTVQLMDDDFSVDYKKWWPKFFKKYDISTESFGRRLPNDKKVTLSVSQFYEFYYDRSTPGVVHTRNFIDVLLSDNFNLKETSAVIMPTTMDKAYEGKCLINAKKIKDLQALLKYIPQDNMDFLDNIVKWLATYADSEDDCLRKYQHNGVIHRINPKKTSVIIIPYKDWS